MLEPVSKVANEPKIFIITPGQPLTQVAKNLENENLVKNAFAFRLLVGQMGISRNIQAGDFRLHSQMSSRDIAQELTHGAIDVWVTLPEGLRIEEQAEVVEAKLKFGESENFNFSKKDYVKLAKEGYMFPDTYLIAKDATAAQVSSRLSQTFDEKTKAILENNQSGLTKEDAIILASLIEREARNAQEKPVIAGILINRLNAGMALQVDATVQYAKGYDSAKNSWWPTITQDDYRSVRSPYNTYLNAGLPPTPISNPGIDSMKAAISPQDSDYFYYLHDSEGKVHYAETVEEHNRNVQEFL